MQELKNCDKYIIKDDKLNQEIQNITEQEREKYRLNVNLKKTKSKLFLILTTSERNRDNSCLDHGKGKENMGEGGVSEFMA